MGAENCLLIRLMNCVFTGRLRGRERADGIYGLTGNLTGRETEGGSVEWTEQRDCLAQGDEMPQGETQGEVMQCRPQMRCETRISRGKLKKGNDRRWKGPARDAARGSK